MSHRESRHVPTQETGQGLLLVIPADTMVGVMGTEPPPAALHEALRGRGRGRSGSSSLSSGKPGPSGKLGSCAAPQSFKP